MPEDPKTTPATPVAPATQATVAVTGPVVGGAAGPAPAFRFAGRRGQSFTIAGDFDANDEIRIGDQIVTPTHRSAGRIKGLVPDTLKSGEVVNVTVGKKTVKAKI